MPDSLYWPSTTFSSSISVPRTFPPFTVNFVTSNTLIVPLMIPALTSVNLATVPSAAASLLIADNSTEPDLIVPVQSVFGCLPITSFSQNVGLVAMTKVVNRFTIGIGAIIMIIAGIFPIFGALLATLPDAVLGGCTIMMFGTIVVSGLQMISKCGYSQRNITIAALALSTGIGFTQVPEIFNIFPQIVQNIFAENCVAVVFLVAIILNLVLPKNMEAA